MKATTFILLSFFLNTFVVVGIAQTTETETAAAIEKKKPAPPKKPEEAKKGAKMIANGKKLAAYLEKPVDPNVSSVSQAPKPGSIVEGVTKPMGPGTIRKTQNDDEYHKGEVYLGFSGAITLDDEIGFEGGGNVSGVYYFHRYIGAKVDFSATFQDISTGTHSLYNFTGGVQFKDSSKDKKYKPFVHALVGVGVHKDTNDNFPQFDRETTGLSTIFGGGLDIKVSDNIDIRAFQLDINPIFSEDRTGFNRTFYNVRYGAGVVFNF